MPHKANDPRRHKFPKARDRIETWPVYDAALRDRGDLTVWGTPEALVAWPPPATGHRGRSPTYSDVAIETGQERCGIPRRGDRRRLEGLCLFHMPLS